MRNSTTESGNQKLIYDDIKIGIRKRVKDESVKVLTKKNARMIL